MPKKKVIIVGGSFAGRTARRQLQREFDVVLIDSKGYFEYVPSTLRCLVEPKYAHKIILDQPNGTVTAAVRSINQNEVLLSNGVTETFDYCLLCTGSSYPRPIKPDVTAVSSKEERIKEIENASQRLEHAQKVAVVGGGAVGVEFAAEIVGKWPGRKHVTLITSHANLLERMSEKARKYAKAWLEKRGVEVIVNERVVRWENPIRTESGLEIEADIVYSCIGFGYNPAIIASENGAIHVDPTTLRVDGRENVFACGDCTNTTEEKTAFAADLSAQLASLNIRNHSKNKALLSYPQAVCQGRTSIPQIACISLYKNNAILQINALVVTGLPAALVKRQIEFMQLALAYERHWAKTAWSIMETSNLWISKLL